MPDSYTQLLKTNRVSASGPQWTLKGPFTLEGTGVHSGQTCRLDVLPARDNSGIEFHTPAGRVPASLQAALGNRHHRQTILGNPRGAHVATPEHLLSALHGMGVDNAIIQISAPELPLLDGGARDMAEAIASAGLTQQKSQREELCVTRPVSFAPGEGTARFTAHAFDGLAVTYFVDFGDRVVGRMGASVVVTPESYLSEIAPARTIAFERDIEALRRAGMGLGGSLESVVVIGESGYLNPSLHFPDEVARHKILDLIGDLSLIGRRLRAHIIAERTGHADNIQFAQFLKEQFE